MLINFRRKLDIALSNAVWQSICAIKCVCVSEREILHNSQTNVYDSNIACTSHRPNYFCSLNVFLLCTSVCLSIYIFVVIICGTTIASQHDSISVCSSPSKLCYSIYLSFYLSVYLLLFPSISVPLQGRPKVYLYLSVPPSVCSVGR